jgi:prepilin-type N-terminal cleavage/methylation domain-containing protein
MRHQRGFTLVEILVAFLILTLVITMTMAAFVERTRRLRQANEIILAHQALANEAEHRRRMNYDTLESESAEFVSPTDILEPLPGVKTIVAVKEVQPGVKNVLMTIRWDEGKRQAKLELIRVRTGGSNLW